jgi:hypothetical protein
MGRIFQRKQFSDYLGENRAILDIVTNYTQNPICPEQITLIDADPSFGSSIMNRLYDYSGGSLTSVYCNSYNDSVPENYTAWTRNVQIGGYNYPAWGGSGTTFPSYYYYIAWDTQYNGWVYFRMVDSNRPIYSGMTSPLPVQYAGIYTGTTFIGDTAYPILENPIYPLSFNAMWSSPCPPSPEICGQFYLQYSAYPVLDGNYTQVSDSKVTILDIVSNPYFSENGQFFKKNGEDTYLFFNEPALIFQFYTGVTNTNIGTDLTSNKVSFPNSIDYDNGIYVSLNETYPQAGQSIPSGVTAQTTDIVYFNCPYIISPTPTPTSTPTQTPTPTLTLTPTVTPTPSSTPISFDSDYQAILTYASTQGFTPPSDIQKTYQNQLVVDLKNAGIWTDLDIFYVFATDGDENYAKINWKNPNVYNIIENGAVDFTTNIGFKTNTTNVSNYFDTQYSTQTSKTGYTLTDAARFTWDYDGSGTGVYDGASGGPRESFNGLNDAGQRIQQDNTNLPSAFNNVGVGLKLIQRTSASNVNMYNNTSTPTSFVRNNTSLIAGNQLIFKMGDNSAPGSYRLSLYGLGASMTGKENDLLTSITNYMTTI